MPWRNGWFAIGDQGRRDAEGYLHLRGRPWEMINRGRLKAMPAAVEAALLSHPDVHEAACFAVPHPTLGKDLAAAVVLRAGARLSEQELRPQCHSFSMLQRCRISLSKASGVVRMLVRNKCRTGARSPLRVAVVVVTSKIQALPGQLALMCSGASRARSSQTVSRPWHFS